MINNPVIRGFNPDPSIIRVGEDFYLATSTFEWFPGVNIYKSKDLKTWEIHSRVLDEKYITLEGVPDGGGIWAPCLSYDGKKIYLVYTVVKERGVMMQTDNYLIETDNMEGEWSEAVYLNSVGFDPSLFHDDDGKKYLISLENHYEENKRFNGLFIEEYDPKAKKLVGGRRLLYKEPTGELTEGAHLHKHGGYYYLMKAQGGTGVRHSAQMARSTTLFGPWAEDKKILLHSRDNEKLPLQKAGHADYVETSDGEGYIVHLASRGLGGMCGRETCIQRVCRENGWLRLKDGGNTPFVNVFDGEDIRRDELYDLSENAFLKDFQFLRAKKDGCFKTTERGLEIKGGSGLNSKFDQNLVARRIDEENVTIETKVSFCPDSDRQTAGLVLIYDTAHWYYLYITSKGKGNVAKVMGCDNGRAMYFEAQKETGTTAVLAAKAENGKIAFFVDGEEMETEVDAFILSDEHICLGFTGAMAGINCIDCEKRQASAVYEYFLYNLNADVPRL